MEFVSTKTDEKRIPTKWKEIRIWYERGLLPPARAVELK